jgi:hypothetical protein
MVCVGHSYTLALSKLFRHALSGFLMLLKLTLFFSNSRLHHTGVWGNGCIAPRILELVCSFTPLPPYFRGSGPPLSIGPRTVLDDIEKTNLASTGT